MTLVYFGFILVSAVLDIVANMFLAKSKGFTRRSWGISAIVLVWLAFWILSHTVRYVDLAVAYAIWGAVGIIGTAVGARIFLKNRLRPVGWLGIAILALAVILLTLA